MFMDNGRPRPCLAPLRDVGGTEYLVHPGREKLFERPSQSGADDLEPQPVDGAVWPQDGHHPPPATKKREKVRFANSREAQQGWTSAPHKSLHLCIGDLHGLGLKAEGTSRRLNPAPERLTPILSQTRGRGQKVHGPRRQAPCACERLEYFA